MAEESGNEGSFLDFTFHLIEAQKRTWREIKIDLTGKNP